MVECVLFNYLRFIDFIINRVSLFVPCIFNTISGRIKDLYDIWNINSGVFLKKNDMGLIGPCCSYHVDEEIVMLPCDFLLLSKSHVNPIHLLSCF